MESYYFRKLDVYKRSMNLTKDIYVLLKKYPSEERYDLCSQIRRAVTSIPINIAEGFGRFSSKEKAHFISIAYGSLTEISCELELSMMLNYISVEEFGNIENQLLVIGKQLSSLHSSILKNSDKDGKIPNP